MLSRVADSIYWMSRYVERAENIARFIDVNFNLMLDLPVQFEGDAMGGQWLPLVTTTGDQAIFEELYGAPTRESVTQFLAFDPKYPNSITSCLRAARENARSVREAISSEMWEQINKYYLFVRDAARQGPGLDDSHTFFTQVRMSSQLFSGITDATMSHNEGWHFARMGRLLERADKTSRILDVKYFMLLPQVEDVGTPFDNLQWAALLKSAGALEMYRKQVHRISPSTVADFLILDRHFPRSMLFCVMRAEESLHAISGTPTGTFQNAAEQKMGRLRSELSYAQIEEVISDGLHQYLDEFQTRLNDVGAAIFETFFGPRPVIQAGSSHRQTQVQVQSQDPAQRVVG